MASRDIYKEISKRTNGDIYIGVVGPVRCGKSTFIKRFMEESVIPGINDYYDRQRTIDALPQSADGRTVMTAEPKFIPDEAIQISAGAKRASIRMIDCVGYMIEGASSGTEDGSERMVSTPWSDSPLPFSEAAELGTRKVISDHSTIAILVTTDGTATDIPRESYVAAEERLVAELKSKSIPFVIVINSRNPSNEGSIQLAYSLEAQYKTPVALINAQQMDSEDIEHILALILEEFPVTELKFKTPAWARNLDGEHWLKRDIIDTIRKISDEVGCVGDIENLLKSISLKENIKGVKLESVDAALGAATLAIELCDELYYKVISELVGFEIADDAALVKTLDELSQTKRAYDRVAQALSEVEEKGYGIVMPTLEELTLQEPKIVKHSGSYGVKLKACAQSIHMIRANIETEINPIVGTEEQSQELIKYLLREFESNPASIWQSNMFGKSLYELVNEGLHNKLAHMPEESREKLSETLERIINEGSGGLICILL